MDRAGKIVPSALAFEASLALVAVGLGTVLGRSPLALLSPGWVPALAGTLATLPTLLALWLVLRSSAPSIRRLIESVDTLVAPLFRGCSILELALISIAAGVGEELLFRGLIQAELSAWLGPIAGVAGASLAFGLAHLITPTYALGAAVMGAYLGWLFLAFDSLLVPMVTHALYDLVALSYLTRRTALREL